MMSNYVRARSLSVVPATSSTVLVDNAFIGSRSSLGGARAGRRPSAGYFRESALMRRNKGLGSLALNAVPTAAEEVNRAAADQVTTAVTQAMLKAALALGIRTQVPAMQALDWVMSTDNVAGAQQKNVMQLAKRVIVWRTTQRRWAENGKRDDGTAFSWKAWVDLGRAFADAASSEAKLSWDSSPLNVVFQTIRQTGADIKGGVTTLATPSDWPMGAKVAVGIVIVGGVLYALNSFTQFKRTFVPG